MRMPLLVYASPILGIKGNTTIPSGRWRVEFDGKDFDCFSLKLFSPTFPEGLIFDFIGGNKAPEFFVDGSTKIVCEITKAGDPNERISLYLRRIGDGLQHFTNEKRAAGTSG